MSLENMIWVEDFRPRNIDQCILPERIKRSFAQMIESGSIQSYSAIGSPGSGKTSSARALCDQLGIDYIVINMSTESGIDTVRTKIINFASTMSFNSAYKVIIMDEFDGANRAAQAALRGVIPEFAENCRFIITGNYQNRIMDALYSRCPMIDFEFTKEERVEMLMQFIKRVEEILKSKNIIYNRAELATFCKKHFPDFRSILNTLQLNSTSGELAFNSMGVASVEKVKEIIDIISADNFVYDECRAWVVNNVQSNDSHLIRQSIYENIKALIKSDSIPAAILLINKYDFQESQVVSKEINFVAFLIELAMNVEFVK